MPQLKNNQYASLAREEYDEEKDTKSTGVENVREIIGVCHNDEITGVDSDNESTEYGSIGATDELDETALIEEAIAETDLDIAEGTDLLSGTKRTHGTKT